MRTHDTVAVPATTRQVCTGRTCDLCGAISTAPQKADHDGEWTGGSYAENETEITGRVSLRHREGTCSPDGGWGKEIEVDICPICFLEKLIPWLKEQGSPVEYKEYDW